MFPSSPAPFTSKCMVKVIFASLAAAVRQAVWRNAMPSLWTESQMYCDVEDSEEPAIRARRIVESEAKRAAAECARMPDIRVDLVREMRALIESGRYHVTAGELADAMIRSAGPSF